MKIIIIYLTTCSLAMSQLVITKFDTPDANGFTGKVELLNDVTFDIIRSGIAERIRIMDWIPELSKIDESSQVAVDTRGFPLSYELNGNSVTITPNMWYIEDAPDYYAFDIRETNDGQLAFITNSENNILVEVGDKLTIKKFTWYIQRFDEAFHEDAIGTFDGEVHLMGFSGLNLSEAVTLKNKFIDPDGAVAVSSTVEKAIYLEFQTVLGSSYGLFASEDLSSWSFTGDEVEGNGTLMGFFVRTVKPKEFFQVLKKE